MPVEATCGLYRRFGYDLVLVTATVECAGHLATPSASAGARVEMAREGVPLI